MLAEQIARRHLGRWLLAVCRDRGCPGDRAYGRSQVSSLSARVYRVKQPLAPDPNDAERRLTPALPECRRREQHDRSAFLACDIAHQQARIGLGGRVLCSLLHRCASRCLSRQALRARYGSGRDRWSGVRGLRAVERSMSPRGWRVGAGSRPAARRGCGRHRWHAYLSTLNVVMLRRSLSADHRLPAVVG